MQLRAVHEIALRCASIFGVKMLQRIKLYHIALRSRVHLASLPCTVYQALLVHPLGCLVLEVFCL